MDVDRVRRRIVPIVDSRFQWKYTLIIMGIGIGITAVLSWFLYSSHRENNRLLELDGNRILQEQIMRSEQIFLLYLLIAVVVMAVALMFWGLVVTHRISGPLYIVARYLNTLAEGRYPDLRPLRKGDELQAFFNEFESAIVAMRARDEQHLHVVEEILSKQEAALGADVLGRVKSMQTTLSSALSSGAEP